MTELLEPISPAVIENQEAKSKIEKLLATKEYLNKELLSVEKELKDINLQPSIINALITRRDSINGVLLEIKTELDKFQINREKAA